MPSLRCIPETAGRGSERSPTLTRGQSPESGKQVGDHVLCRLKGQNLGALRWASLRNDLAHVLSRLLVFQYFQELTQANEVSSPLTPSTQLRYLQREKSTYGAHKYPGKNSKEPQDNPVLSGGIHHIEQVFAWAPESTGDPKGREMV